MFFFSAVKKGTLLVDSSTIDPSVAQTVAQEAKKNGVRFIDGPVSGGIYHRNFSVI